MRELAAGLESAVDESPLALTDVLFIRPGEAETYYLPMNADAVISLDLVADGVCEVRILRKAIWLSAADRASTPALFCARADCLTGALPIACPSDDCMLLIINPSPQTVRALVQVRTDSPVSTGPANTAHLRPAKPSIRCL